MLTKICIVGACGRMGKMLVQSVIEDVACHLSGAIESRDCDCLDQDIGTLVGQEAVGIELTDRVDTVLADTDVIIDFSSPQFLSDNLSLIQSAGVAIVVGTTALQQEQMKLLSKASVDIPVLSSPNMSLGVNLLFELVELSSRLLQNDFDIEIIEKHHNKKQDSPSGTAVRLLSLVMRSLGVDDNHVIYGRQGDTGSRPRRQVGVHAVRAGSIIGEHDVVFGGEDEILTLSHQAISRNIFVKGAIHAAKFIAFKDPGIYTMKDVLGISSQK